MHLVNEDNSFGEEPTKQEKTKDGLIRELADINGRIENADLVFEDAHYVHDHQGSLIINKSAVGEELISEIEKLIFRRLEDQRENQKQELLAKKKVLEAELKEKL